jgi:hypothetical protein
MAFKDHAEYPRGIWHTSVLDGIPIEVFADGTGEKKICWIKARGGAANETIVFQLVDNTEVWRFWLSPGEHVFLSQGFVTPALGGLEVRTTSPAGDVELTIAYVVP